MAATYEPIATYTITSGTPLSYEFTSIPQTYTDLVLITAYAGNYGSPERSQLGIQMGNGSVDTNAIYSYTVLTGDGTTASTDRDTALTQFTLGTYPLGNSATQQNNSIVHFMNYSNTTTYKTLLSRNTHMNTSNNTSRTHGRVLLWRSTSAINTIKIKDFAGAYYFHVGTYFTLYGIKAA